MSPGGTNCDNTRKGFRIVNPERVNDEKNPKGSSNVVPGFRCFIAYSGTIIPSLVKSPDPGQTCPHDGEDPTSEGLSAGSFPYHKSAPFCQTEPF
jgi:hypothetical protein